MKNLIIIFFLMTTTLVTNAQRTEVKDNVNSQLAIVANELDACRVVIATNKMIKMGDSAVTALSDALLSEEVANQSKWSAAMALGQIGNAQALSILEQVEKTTTDSWLKSISQDAISMIKAEIPRDGKVYVYAFGVKKTKIDCEAGTSELIK